MIIKIRGGEEPVMRFPRYPKMTNHRLRLRRAVGESDTDWVVRQLTGWNLKVASKHKEAMRRYFASGVLP